MPPIFLANAFLMFAAVAIVPIMLHLLHRKRPQPIMFAAMRFLTDAIAKSRRSRRVTQCLTLLMRILIILLLALAFARPVVKFSKLTFGKQRTVLIVLDSSASMQAVRGDCSLFESSRDWALNFLDTLAEGDRVGVLAPGCQDETVVYPPVSDHSTCKAALQELKPAFGHADIVSSLTKLFSKNEADFRNMEIHVFSDFQKSAWNGEASEAFAKKLSEAGTLVYFNRIGMLSSGDAGFTGVNFIPPALMGANAVTANAEVHANAQYAGGNVVHIENSGRELNHAAVDLMPGETSPVAISLDAGGDEQQLCGLLRCEDDAYPLNNTFYFTLPRVSGVPAAVVDGTGPRDSFFLRHALKPGGQAASLVEPFEVDWNTFVATEAGETRIAFICNPPELDDAALSRIGSMLASGKDVVIFPGDANGMTQEALGKLKALSDIQVARNENPEAFRLEVTGGSSNAPYPRRLATILPPPWSFPARANLRMSLPSQPSSMMLNGGDGAFLLSAVQGPGRIWLFAVSANRDWSDWPVMPSFLVCIQELARFAANRSTPSLMAQVGSDLSFPWPGQSVSKQSLEMTVTAPDGSSRKAVLMRENSAQPFILSGFAMPGIHTISDGNHEMRFAVNIPTDETVLDYDSSAELLGKLSGVEAVYSTSPEELFESIQKARQGNPLWPLLLCMAFFLSIVEVIFANMRSRATAVPKTVNDILNPLAAIAVGKSEGGSK